MDAEDLEDWITEARAKDHLGWDNDDDRLRYMLLEENFYDKSAFVTTFDTPEEAAVYHDGQEYPEDWRIVALVDTQTGEEYYPVTTTTWELRPE